MAEIAINEGFKFGAQLPNTVYHPLFMADQDWKNPNRKRYMDELAKYRPEIATVLDWEREEQLSEVLSWAEEAAQFVQRVMVVPKVQGGIARLPRRIGGKDVILAYSVPTKFSGTGLMLLEFAGWPIHLLGGSPHAQINVYLHLFNIADVVTVDGNYSSKMATRYCQFWSRNERKAKDRHWPLLREVDGEIWGKDAPYEAFRRSCVNIMEAWNKLCKQEG